jgi:NitT/TauT family transport system substrate-binding protein
MNRRYFGLGVAAALAGCGGGEKQDSPVRIAMARAGILYLPVYLAQSLGYFREEGAAVEFYETAGGSKAMEALVGGNADAMISGHNQVLQVAVQERPVKTFFCLGKTIAVALVLAAGARQKNISDLKGAPLGVTSPGSGSHLDLNFLLSLENVRPQEVVIVGIGALAAAVSALERGRVQAAMMYSNALTSYVARNPTARILADLRTPEGFKKVTGADRCAGIVIASTDGWLQENATAARAIGRALRRAMQWLLEHSPAEARGRLPAEYHSQDAAADLEAIGHQTADLNPDGVTTVEMVKVTQRMLAVSIPEVASLEAAKTFTNEFLQA